jgi:prefoldin subunit 5
MKKYIALVTIVIGIASSARAQWIVYDPTMNIQQIIDTAQEIAKYVQMINNQVQEIQTLTAQLNEFKHYEDLFGNPASVLVNTMPKSAAELIAPELGQNLTQLVTDVVPADALTYSENGIYHVIGPTFTTPLGNTIARNTNDFAPYAAVNTTTRNFLNVSTNAAANREAIKSEIAKTVTALNSATTDAQVQKLSATLTALGATLNSVDHEVNQALGSALVQDIENRNDEQKQMLAQKEQQQAEFYETTTNYNAKLQLLADPVYFPTGN